MTDLHSTSKMSTWAPPAPTPAAPPAPLPAPSGVPSPAPAVAPPPAPVVAPPPSPTSAPTLPADDWDVGSLEGGRAAAPSATAAWGHGGKSPFTPNPAPRRTRRRLLPLLLLAVLAIGAGAAYALFTGGDDGGDPAVPTVPEVDALTDPAAPGGEGDPAAAPVETVAPEDPAAAPEVTSAATSSDLSVSVGQVVDPWTSGNDVEIPAPGNRFVAVEMTLTNTSGGETSFSTLTGIDVQDATGEKWAVAYAGFDLPALDGQLASGESRTGWAVFELPADRTGLVVRVRGSIIAPPATFPI